MNSFIEFNNFTSLLSSIFVIAMPLPIFFEFLIELNVFFLANSNDFLIFLFFTIEYSTEEKLLNSINKFTEIKNIYKNIPECQTNFVYSKQKPKSIKEILGISGRIVKSGKEVIVAGDLVYGGSKHVATALLTVNKKYSKIQSAINIKYKNDTISKIKKLKLTTYDYDRNHEPKNVKNGGSTIEWGIKNAIKNSKKPPDIIYHKGDFGKEPMIIVFAETPDIVIKKILKII